MRRSSGVLVVLAAVALLGCTPSVSDKAGGAGGTTTLRLALPDPPGRPSSLQAEDFAERVRGLSRGRLRIEVVTEAAGRSGTGLRAWDQATAQRVVDGGEELALVPARAWDELGVETLQPLQAPWLITSDEALDAVVTDEVADDLMHGLQEVGLTGLALLPEGLRHPVATQAALVAAADYAGVVVRAPLASVPWATLRALGAEPRDLDGNELVAAVQDGGLGGAETSLELLPSLPFAATVTGNVVLYAKANVLVVADRAMERLTAGERSVLRRAALASRDAAVEDRPRETELLRRACGAGTRVAVASDDQLRELERTTRPVVDRLRDDTEVSELLDRVTAVVGRSRSGDAVAPCDGTGALGGGAQGRLASTDGVWRVDVPYEDGIAAGLPPARAGAELGVQTVRLAGGSFDWSWRSHDGTSSCAGTYRSTGSLVVFTEEPRCGAVWEARATVRGDTVSWSQVRSRVVGDPQDQTLRELLHSRPWRRVAPAEVAFPAGVYRWRVDEAQYAAAGVDASTAYSNSGLMTLTVADGRWRHHTDHASHPPDCGGTYAVSAGRVTFTVDCEGDVRRPLFSAEWEPLPDGVQLRRVQPDDAFTRVMWTASPWRRVG